MKPTFSAAILMAFLAGAFADYVPRPQIVGKLGTTGETDNPSAQCFLTDRRRADHTVEGELVLAKGFSKKIYLASSDAAGIPQFSVPIEGEEKDGKMHYTFILNREFVASGKLTLFTKDDMLELKLRTVEIRTPHADSDDQSLVTPRFLLDRGFVQSTNDPTLYTLKGLTVAQAGDRLGFSLTDLVPGTNNPPDQDIRLVVVRDYEFALVSEPKKNFAGDALNNPQTLCTVEARLIPELRRRKGVR